MARQNLAEQWRFHLAVRRHVRASRMKVTARRRIYGIRHFARKNNASAAILPRLRTWNSRKQGFGVRMLRRMKQVPAPCQLDNLTEIHHRYTMAHVFDDG